jgi:hypothetical protein
MHTMTRALTGALLVVTLAACSTMSPSRPARSEFEDIPVPKGLAYVEGDSTIIESPNVKAAKLVYRGRVEPVSLGSAIRSTLEANGWRHLSTATAGSAGTTQVYDKAQGNSLQVKVWEGWYYTYVELTASRATAASTTPGGPAWSATPAPATATPVWPAPPATSATPGTTTTR